ncbi:hypothetical protein KFE25_003338 [Diacronema lutheri]|uniref:EamA domain-containing protein n=1 Tax=Diacronema lutheri TaxID=2081491 RepID=A0A8J5XRV6_DIALT|nr:hypothetical protein KFE25_003338 [Diacronema lutheri]
MRGARRPYTGVLPDEATTAGDVPADAGAPRRMSGVPLVIIAAFSFSIHGCSVRIASDAGFTTVQLSFVVGLVRVLLATAIMPAYPKWWPAILCGGHDLAFVGLVIFRNLVGCAALVCIFQAYARMPIGEGTSLVFTAPIWTTLLARVWLGEPITRYNAAAVALAVAGVSLIATGSDSAEPAPASALELGGDAAGGRALSERSVGIALALLGALALSCVMVATRRIGERMPAIASIGWYGFALTALSATTAALLGEPLVPRGMGARLWLLVLGGAALSFVAQTLNTMALQRLEAGRVQVLGTLEICFSFAWQALFLHTPLSARSALGALAIISCAALAAAQGLLARQPDASESAAGARAADVARAASWKEGPADGAPDRRAPPPARHAPLPVEQAPEDEDGERGAWRRPKRTSLGPL